MRLLLSPQAFYRQAYIGSLKQNESPADAHLLRVLSDPAGGCAEGGTMGYASPASIGTAAATAQPKRSPEGSVKGKHVDYKQIG